jgi:transcriptional regulator with XRE-family HTH domain
MRSRNISRKELATEVGVSEPRLSQIFSERSNLTIKTIARVVHALQGSLKIQITAEKAEPWWEQLCNKASPWQTDLSVRADGGGAQIINFGNLLNRISMQQYELKSTPEQKAKAEKAA